MTSHLSLSQLTLLVGGAVVTGALLLLLIYGLHKAIRRQLEEEDVKPTKPRIEDDTAFALAALQGVVADLKEEHHKLAQRLREAERQAEESTRLTRVIVQETNQGVIVFDREGFVRLANPAAYELLGVDAWSRRPYGKVLERVPALAELVQACLETGRAARQQAVAYPASPDTTRNLVVSVLPLQAVNGRIDAALCLVQRPPETLKP